MLGADLKGPIPTSEHLLVLLDYRSRYPVVSVMKNGISSSEIIKKLGKIFSIFGYPVKILTDDGKQFISSQFKQFLNDHNIQHHPVSPYWPQANGEVERFNRTLGKMLQCAATEGKDWRSELNKFLLQYRTTPHPATGETPANMLFNYQPKNDLPSHKNNTKTLQQQRIDQKDRQYKLKIKSYADSRKTFKPNILTEGDQVLCQNMQGQI